MSFGTGWWLGSKTPGFGGGDSSVGGTLPAPWDWQPAGQRVAVAFYGDSISVGAYGGGTTETNWLASGFVGQLRTTLQARHGDGGIGFINLGRHEWVKTGTWTQIADYGPFAQCWSATSDATKLWTLTVAEGDNIDIYYLNGAGYGPFDVVVDGGAPVTITPSGSANNATKKANISLGSEGAHTVVVKAPASGTLYFLGAAVYKGTTGVVVHNIARSGSAVNDLAFQVASKLGVVPLLAPKLNVLGYTANDFSAQTTLASFSTRMNAVAAQLKLAGGGLMTWIPPDNALTGKAIPVSEYEAITRATALSNGGLWLDSHRAWGPYANNIARMYDTIHPNTVGHTALHNLFLKQLERLGA